jgi:hypothetical protein
VQTIFIVRLLNTQRDVLAWTRVPAETKGDGCLWPMQAFVAEGDVHGTGVAICVHWPDVNVHTTIPLEGPIPVDVGKVVSYAFSGPLLRIGSDTQPLPPVTQRSSVEIGVGAARA